jgi:hypothetical protein
MRTTMRSTIALMLAMLAAGCTAPPAMKLSPDLAAVSPQPVSGREAFLGRGVLVFDRWNSTVPARIPNDHWLRVTNSIGTGAGEVDGIRVDRAALDFSVRSGSGAAASTTQSNCVARGRFAKHTAHRGRATDETSVNIQGYPRIDCDFNGARAGQLSLRPSWLSQRDSGAAEFGARRWTVESVNNVESQRTNFPLTRFGYEFSSKGKVVAAVETWGAGRVWIDPALDEAEQDELAVATTALLYYASLLEYEDD